MEVGEVVRRVGLAYWPLILGLAFAGALGAGLLHLNEPPIYTSDVRFVLDTTDPRAGAEATSIADTAKSIATSPSHVAAALRTAGVTRDVQQFATRNIELLPLGTSGVMDLQVKDTDRLAASVIANTLAVDILNTRDAVNAGEANRLLTSLNGQMASLDTSIAQVDANIANYHATSDPSVSAAALSGLYSERASLAQERQALQTEIDQINQQLALRPQSSIIDPALPAAAADPSRAPIDMALGGLGGLVAGILLAALLATLRPRITGRRQLSLLFDAPVLGDFDQDAITVLPALVRIAAHRAGVKHVQLMALDGSPEAVNLVNVLAAKFAAEPAHRTLPIPLNGNGQAVVPPRSRQVKHHELEVMPFDPSFFSKNGNSTETGLVLVAPNVIDKDDLDASSDVISLTGWPVAGVVTYTRRSHRRRGIEAESRLVDVRQVQSDASRALNPYGYRKG